MYEDENKMKIVKVVWMDAKTYTSVELTLKEAKEKTLAETHTIGYLLHEDKEKIVVCGFYCPSVEDEYADGYRDIHIIPKPIIVKIIKLEEKK